MDDRFGDDVVDHVRREPGFEPVGHEVVGVDPDGEQRPGHTLALVVNCRA